MEHCEIHDGWNRGGTVENCEIYRTKLRRIYCCVSTDSKYSLSSLELLQTLGVKGRRQEAWFSCRTYMIFQLSV